MSNLHWHGYGELFVIDAEYVEDFHIYIYVHLHNFHLNFIFYLLSYLHIHIYVNLHNFHLSFEVEENHWECSNLCTCLFQFKSSWNFKCLFQNSFLLFEEHNTPVHLVRGTPVSGRW